MTDYETFLEEVCRKENISKYEELSRNQALTLLKKYPGLKITHELFSFMTEYIQSTKKGTLITEEGYLFEDWFSEDIYRHDGFRIRSGGVWEKGWYFFKESRI